MTEPKFKPWNTASPVFFERHFNKECKGGIHSHGFLDQKIPNIQRALQSIDKNKGSEIFSAFANWKEVAISQLWEWHSPKWPPLPWYVQWLTLLLPGYSNKKTDWTSCDPLRLWDDGFYSFVENLRVMLSGKLGLLKSRIDLLVEFKAFAVPKSTP